MKSISRLLLSALFLSAGTLALQHPAMALTSINGTVCKPYGNSNIAGLYSFVNGVYNGTTAAMGVVCPVVRVVTSGTVTVKVDGSASSAIVCGLYAYNYNGAYLGSYTFTVPGTVTLTVPNYSSQSIYCSLPANGRLYDLFVS